jgi:hypothetical protein
VDSVRDLARSDPWRESLERSLERRGGSKASSPGVGRGRRRAAAPRLRIRIPTERIVGALALLAALLASVLAGGGTETSPTAARADVPGAAARASRAGSSSRSAGTGTAGAADVGTCAQAVAPEGYVNPLEDAFVKPERIDQGVDYAGTGTLRAIGTGRVSYVATSNTGWPGAFIEYQLLDGADAGCYVFYAEGVIPADGMRVGQTLSAGQPVATIIPKYPSGIEIGWGAGISTKAYAKVAGQWSTADDQDNVATAAGKNFSALIAVLGGPPGKVEG